MCSASLPCVRRGEPRVQLAPHHVFAKRGIFGEHVLRFLDPSGAKNDQPDQVTRDRLRQRSERPGLNDDAATGEAGQERDVIANT